MEEPEKPYFIQSRPIKATEYFMNIMQTLEKQQKKKEEQL